MSVLNCHEAFVFLPRKSTFVDRELDKCLMLPSSHSRLLSFIFAKCVHFGKLTGGHFLRAKTCIVNMQPWTLCAKILGDERW